MKKTVQELILMYENGKGTLPSSMVKSAAGKLYTDMSTQRNFVYNTIKTVDEQDNEISKAGYLIQSIIEKHIQLPALYFWNVQDDEARIHYAKEEFNIHDGKQRFLSIYNFIRGIDPVITRVDGSEKKFSDLTADQQNYLLNYEFDIVVRTGTLKEEEQSFFLINTTGEPLTYYEGLRGAYYGTYIYEFEKFIDNLKYDKIKKVGRGEQAIWFLYLALGIIDEDKKLLLTSAKSMLEKVRTTSFDRNHNKFAEKIELYNEFCALSMTSKNSEKNPQKIAKLVNYIINHGYDSDKIIYYYKKGFKTINDIDKWKYETHIIAINALVNDGIELDYRRFFNDIEKSQLYAKSHICGVCGNRFNYNDLEVDHMKPWSKGGRTDLTNAQLLCKSCNSSKGGKI